MVLIAPIGATLLWWTAQSLAIRAVRRAIDRFARAHDASWVRKDAGIDISLLHGDLLLRRLDFVPRQPGDTGLAGHVDTMLKE